MFPMPYIRAVSLYNFVYSNGGHAGKALASTVYANMRKNQRMNPCYSD
jgi:hypothetical protein